MGTFSNTWGPGLGSSGGSSWTPQTPLADGNTVAWYDSSDLTTITKDTGTGEVSLWKDKLLSGHDLIQNLATKKPIWSVDGILFDGINDYLKSATFEFGQPEQIYIVFKQKTWTRYDQIIDGDTYPSGYLTQDASTPAIKASVGSGGSSTEDINLAVDTFGIIRILFNGAESKLVVNNNQTSYFTSTTTRGMNGITLAARGNLVSSFANVQFKELIFRNKKDVEPNEILIYNYLANKYELPTIVNRTRAPGICLNFDDPIVMVDNLDSWVAADEILKSYGWKASFAVSTSSSNTTNDQDITEVNTVKDRLITLTTAGNELMNHGIRHSNLSTYLAVPHTRQEFYDNIILPMQTIMTDAFGTTPKTFVQPNWYGTDLVMDTLLLENGFTNIRDNSNTFPTIMRSICYDGYSQSILSLDIAPFPSNPSPFSDAQIISLLDYARDNNMVLNLFSHRIVTTVDASLEVPLARLEMICQYIVNNNMKFYKMSELVPSIFGL